MAKIKFGALAEDARGKIDGIVYSRNQFGAYARQKVSPVQPQTARQTLVRERMTTLSKRFSTIISEADRLAWNAFAKVNPVVDVFGNPQALGGISAYNRLNGVILNAGGTIIDTPPADLAVNGLESMTAAATAVGAATAVTASAIAANVLTLTFAAHPYVIGSQLALTTFAGLGAFLNGNTVTVLTFDATHITAAFVHADVAAGGAGLATEVNGVVLTFGASPLGAAEVLYIWASQGLSAGRQFFKPNLRFIGVSAAAAATPYQAGVQYSAKFGSLIVGTAIGFLVGVCDPAKGAVTPGIFARVVVA
jgi:hypothetical protein